MLEEEEGGGVKVAEEAAEAAAAVSRGRAVKGKRPWAAAKRKRGRFVRKLVLQIHAGTGEVVQRHKSTREAAGNANSRAPLDMKDSIDLCSADPRVVLPEKR